MKQAQFDKAKSLVKSGTPVKEACKTAGISTPTYYRWSKMKKKTRLTVHELPAQVHAGQAFIVFGSPQALAEFARSYS